MPKTSLEIHNELFDAASGGHIDVIESLLRSHRGKIDINATDVAGRTPLILASQNGHSKAVRVLIEKGANINKQDASTNSALSIAFMREYNEIVDLLLEREEIEIPNIIIKDTTKKLKLLQQVVHHNNIVCTKKILSSIPDAFNLTQIGGAYPLTNILKLAVRNGNIKIVDLLLKRRDIATSLTGSLLTEAAKSGRLEITKSLVNRGVDINATDEIGRTPLMLAVMNGHLKTVETLIAKGADINKQDAATNSPLNFAVLKGDAAMVKMLLKHNADYTAKTGGKTSHMLASANGNQEIVKLLLANNINLNEKDLSGKTALMLAKDSGHKDIIWDLKLAGWKNQITNLIKGGGVEAKHLNNSSTINIKPQNSDLLGKFKRLLTNNVSKSTKNDGRHF